MFDHKARSGDSAKKEKGPCYVHFGNKGCPGNCGFDHSDEAMRKLMQQRVKTMLDSPYVPAEYVEREIALRKRQTAAARMVHSLSKVFEKREEESEPLDTSEFQAQLSRLTAVSSPLNDSAGNHSISEHASAHSQVQPEFHTPPSATRGSS